ncbi:TetR/AcrR family transcriptional regulator [Kitasatospora viridis]|uniref:TetR family transcriptional regulator n=1 Tax=Kitasatospora viridis TaxID=281105 RepID=A0A561TT45_9ACTN|nr:TetR/AcrR family transcriptional regulator [Kitasatospora viridis]TWF90296.1 TetR family transcriptional regulator [Kitasatospora viridis]
MPAQPNPERRNERSRRAILDALYDLAVEKGYAKVTIEAVATRAGVGKPTIYRWWASKGAVALEVINDRIGTAIDFPNTGDIVADLTSQITAVTGIMTGDLGRLYRGVIGECQTDPKLAQELRATVLEPRIRFCTARLDAAVADGQLRTDLPTRTMVDVIYAPVYYRWLLSAGDAEVRGCPALVPEIIAGLLPR